MFQDFELGNTGANLDNLKIAEWSRRAEDRRSGRCDPGAGAVRGAAGDATAAAQPAPREVVGFPLPQ